MLVACPDITLLLETLPGLGLGLSVGGKRLIEGALHGAKGGAEMAGEPRKPRLLAGSGQLLSCLAQVLHGLVEFLTFLPRALPRS